MTRYDRPDDEHAPQFTSADELAEDLGRELERKAEHPVHGWEWRGAHVEKRGGRHLIRIPELERQIARERWLVEFRRPIWLLLWVSLPAAFGAGLVTGLAVT